MSETLVLRRPTLDEEDEVIVAHERLGLDRILVTCDDDNIGSIRTIESNGGILEGVIGGPELDKPKRRHWIEVGTGPA